MFPGINKRQMEQAMKKMGIQQQELDAQEVIIKLSDREIVISNPSVSKVNMMGQQTYQIIGKETIRQLSANFQSPSNSSSQQEMPEIGDEDVKTVMEQANVNEPTARSAIMKHNGDLAEAIMELKK